VSYDNLPWFLVVVATVIVVVLADRWWSGGKGLMAAMGGSHALCGDADSISVL
jgi:preprotein translocase subunit SecG